MVKDAGNRTKWRQLKEALANEKQTDKQLETYAIDFLIAYHLFHCFISHVNYPNKRLFLLLIPKEGGSTMKN